MAETRSILLSYITQCEQELAAAALAEIQLIEAATHEHATVPKDYWHRRHGAELRLVTARRLLEALDGTD